MKFGTDEIVSIIGASARDTREGQPHRIVTDTRSIEPGDAFLALRGEIYDGHDFVGDAFAKGASLAIVSRMESVASGRPVACVDNTLSAYMALATEARVRFRGTVLAITGSAGKTTTKALLAQLLAHTGLRAGVTPQNENNEIGVSKMLLALSGEEDVAIVEMGCRHTGDITTLVNIARPHVGILTNVGEAHLAIMKTREAIAETKWEMFSQGAEAILNLADEPSRERIGRLMQPARWFAFGRSALDLALPGDVTVVPERDQVVIRTTSTTYGYGVEMRLPGDHNLANLAAALSGARRLGASIDNLLKAISSLSLPPGRYERIALPSGATAVFDAYNASMSGTIAALSAFAEESADRHIAVLGGMAELGSQSPEMHRTVGAAAAKLGIAFVLCGGPFAAHTAAGARDAGMAAATVIEYALGEDAAAWLRENLRQRDVVLFKGSRSFKMETILADLRDSATAAS